MEPDRPLCYTAAMTTTITKKETVTKVRREITAVLNKYRLGWEDIFPDMDEALWKKTAPAARRLRRELFKKSYPSLYASRRRKA